MFRASKSVEPATETTAEKNVPRYAPRIGRIAIPEPRWDDEPLRCLKINDDWVSHLIGILNVLDQGDTWEGTDDEIADARQQVNQIILALMEDCGMDCCLPPLIQVNPDGTISVSYDNGMTWTDATTDDPRNAAPKLPPVTDPDGSDVKCKSANRVVRQLKDAQIAFADQLGAGLTILQLALAFAAAVVVIFLTAGTLAAVIVPALLALAAALVGTGATAYNDLFTDGFWGDILCTIYCHAQEDGSYNQSDFLAILSDVDSISADPNALLTITSILRGWQLSGLLNASRIPTVDNLSCDDCPCNTTCSAKYHTGTGGYGTILSSTVDTITVEAVYDVRVGGYGAGIIAKNFSDCCLITHDVVSGSITNNSTGYANCGETPNPDSFNHFDITLGGCFSMAVLSSTAPFTVVFNLNPCE